MKSAMIVIAVTLLTFPGISNLWAQAAEKPVRQPGEWWELKIKTENASDRDPFYGLDGDYRIEVAEGEYQCLYREAGKWTDNCGEARGILLNTLLGVGDEKYLSFPIGIGKMWKYSFTDSEGREFSGKSVVFQSENITVAGKKFDTYHIKREGEWRSRSGLHTGPINVLYWYAESCRCIPAFKLESAGHSWGGALMEMKLTNYKVAE